MGELVARCIVESGTSSFYSAIADACDEPLLRDICRRIAADEFRHYKLFYEESRRYASTDGVGRLRRLLIAVGRVRETEDDELAYAFHAAHAPADAPYDRADSNRRYMRLATAVYRRGHIDRATSMIAKAAGLPPRGRLAQFGSWLVYRFMKRRAGPPITATMAH